MVCRQKSDAKSEAQVSYIQSVVTSLYDAIYKTKTKEAVEQFMDIDSAVDMLLFLLIVSDNDANYSSMSLQGCSRALLSDHLGTMISPLETT